MIWSDEMDDFLREYAPDHTNKAVIASMKDRFGVELTISQIKYRRRKLGIKSHGNAGWFTSKNGGFHSDEHKRTLIERGKNTRFKKGNIPHNAEGMPLGTEKMRDGFVVVKVREHRSDPSKNDTYRQKHHLVWEQAHGRKVPEHHVVVFADRNRFNFNPENLVLVHRRYMYVINKFEIPYYDRESLEIAVLTAKLKVAETAKRCAPRPCKVCGQIYKPEYPHQARCRSCIDAGRKVVRNGDERKVS